MDDSPTVTGQLTRLSELSCGEPSVERGDMMPLSWPLRAKPLSGSSFFTFNVTTAAPWSPSGCNELITLAALPYSSARTPLSSYSVLQGRQTSRQSLLVYSVVAGINKIKYHNSFLSSHEFCLKAATPPQTHLQLDDVIVSHRLVRWRTEVQSVKSAMSTDMSK